MHLSRLDANYFSSKTTMTRSFQNSFCRSWLRCFAQTMPGRRRKRQFALSLMAQLALRALRGRSFQI